jgi:DNA-binding NarL/FixJ family response regulator
MKNISVLIVDDHKVVRTGLVSFLNTQQDIEILGEAGSGREALDLLETIVVDVVLMDITMPEMNGMEATRLLKSRFPTCEVLVLTVHEDKQYFFEMLDAGASGYITKDSAAEDLVEAIQTVSRGNVYLQPTLARWLLDDYHRLLQFQPLPEPDGMASTLKNHRSLGTLSEREIEVLGHVAAGLTSVEIASELQISPNTVARHRERIMKKLNLHNAAELTRFAIRSGLITA